MAKDRPSPAQRRKSDYTSASGIFKKSKSHAKSHNERHRPTSLQAPPIPKTKKRKHKAEHPLSAAFSNNIEDSRQKIEQETTARLDDVHDTLVTQIQSSVHNVQNRLSKSDSSNKDLDRPLDDELLELTRKDGTIVTMTLGKRIDAYRKLLKREKQNLARLFEQWQTCSQEIDTLTMELFGPAADTHKSATTHTERPEFENAEQLALMAEMRAEIQRAQTDAAAIGAKAIELMRTGEKVRVPFVTFVESFYIAE
ncbi:MAG: hypothetical protein Q9168_002083 [Polycauliona sp. 1 TL-2023]